jgi:hypothetical protein
MPNGAPFQISALFPADLAILGNSHSESGPMLFVVAYSAGRN